MKTYKIPGYRQGDIIHLINTDYLIDSIQSNYYMVRRVKQDGSLGMLGGISRQIIDREAFGVS